MPRPSSRCSMPPSTVPPRFPATALARFHRAWLRSPECMAPRPLLVPEHPLAGGQAPGGIGPGHNRASKTPGGVRPTHDPALPTPGGLWPETTRDHQTPSNSQPHRTHSTMPPVPPLSLPPPPHFSILFSAPISPSTPRSLLFPANPAQDGSGHILPTSPCSPPAHRPLRATRPGRWPLPHVSTFFAAICHPPPQNHGILEESSPEPTSAICKHLQLSARICNDLQ
jgi:hypothetical protein